MGVNTGTNRSRGGLLVQDNNTTTPEDTVFAYGVREIIVTTGTLTNNGQGTVTITTGGGSGSGSVTSVATAGTVNGLTLTGGTITVAGTITLGGTLAINNADWSGTALSATNGGTGLTTYTTGDIIYSSAANTLSKLGIGSAGEVLTVSAGGIPEWAAGGGSGSGTVNSGTQYQVAYYATTGDAVSGDANLTFNPAAGTTATFVYVGGGATASTQAHPVNLIQETATTPALGFGVGLDYSIKPATGEVLLGRMEVQEQAVVATTETADFVFKLRNTASDPATTNEVFRMTATGGFKSTPSAAGGTVVEVGAGVGGTVTVGGTGSLTTVNGSISAAGANGTINAATDITTTGGDITSVTGEITAQTNLVANTGNIVASAGQVNAPNETINAGKGMTIAAGDLTWGGGSLKQNDPGAYGGAFNDQEFVTRICGTLTTPSDIPDGSALDEVSLLGATWTLEGGNYTMGSAGGGTGYDGTYAGATSTFVSYGTSVTVNLTDASVFDTVVCGGTTSVTGFTIAEYEPFTMQVIGKTAVGNLTIQVFGNAVPL
jgi:hypothetical protein